MSIADLPHAVLGAVSPNEIGFDVTANPDGTPTWDDPTKLRFGAYRPADGRPGFYLGVIGMDVLTAQGSQAPHRNERGFIAFKIDNNDGQPPRPCLEVYLQRTADSDADVDMLCVLRISASGIELDPKGAGGIGINAPVTAKVSRFYSDDSRYVFNVQGDPTPEYPHGRIVQYARNGSNNPDDWTPVAILRPEALPSAPASATPDP